MPVRIYDIAKKLGVESKEVLAKAKELGIAQAKVPSSSLDKITAEYLEVEMGGKPSLPTAEPEPAPKDEPILIVSEPEKPEAPVPEPEAPAEAVVETPAEPEPPEEETEDAADASPPRETGETETQESTEAEDTEEEEVKEPATPAAPPAPKIGAKVGFIQLPTGPSRQSGRDRKAEKRQEKKSRDRKPEQQKAGEQKKSSKPKYSVPDSAAVITLKQPIVVRSLAEELGKKPFQIIADLMELGVFANVNQTVEEDNAKVVCAKYGFKFELEKRARGAGIVKAEPKKVVLDVDDKEEDMVLRPPVVTIMGHVDHGKTTLLDYIREARVAAGEVGGITQHIGAYTISVPHPETKEPHQITFLDTPGHAAFSAMRARGADVTDLVVLVVAANDGVMPQTIEAINHAKAAEVPIIVAVNKCDHPAANPQNARTQLQEHGLMCEEWGGDVIFVDVSALKGENVNTLLEMILLQAEVMELKANPKRKAVGSVIESGMEPGGPVATVLVRKGTLKVGDVIICGQYWGKARALINEEGQRLKSADPSTAVRILGLNGVPDAGLEFNVVKSDKEARHLAEEREQQARQEDQEKRGGKVSLENLFSVLDADASKVLKVVVKGDTQGSVEAIVDALNKIESDKVELEVIHNAVGTVTESDVMLASASNAIILGFHTRIDSSAKNASKREGVQIKQYSIIYELIDEVKEAMAGLLDPEFSPVVVGSAEVRQLFSMSKGGVVAGCMVNNGRIIKGKIRVVRKGDVIHEGSVLSLRRFQDEVNEVRNGLECGIRVSSFNEFKEGDTLESFTLEKIAQSL